MFYKISKKNFKFEDLVWQLFRRNKNSHTLMMEVQITKTFYEDNFAMSTEVKKVCSFWYLSSTVRNSRYINTYKIMPKHTGKQSLQQC